MVEILVAGMFSVMSYNIRKILIAVADPTAKGNKAIRRGADLAGLSGASIELFSSVSLTGSYGDISRAESREFARLLLTQRQTQLERLAVGLRRQGFDVACTVELDYPADHSIVRQVRRSKPDLVLIEAHKHNLFARLLLSQTDFGLIRECPVPLLIVKGAPSRARPVVLAALDPWHAVGKPASLDSRIIEVARGLATLNRGSLHTAHVYAPMFGFVAGSVGGPSSIPISLPDAKRYKASIQKQFQAQNRKHRISSRNAHLRAGDPALELPFLARSIKASTVVMGAVSRSTFKRLFIGNTAERVLDSLPCDVLIVKPPGFRSSVS